MNNHDILILITVPREGPNCINSLMEEIPLPSAYHGTRHGHFWWILGCCQESGHRDGEKIRKYITTARTHKSIFVSSHCSTAQVTNGHYESSRIEFPLQVWTVWVSLISLSQFTWVLVLDIFCVQLSVASMD